MTNRTVSLSTAEPSRSPVTSGAESPQDNSQDNIPADLLAAWKDCWVNRVTPYAEQQPDGTYRWMYRPCDTSLLAAHVTGEVTLALSSADAHGGCRWLCLDLDATDAEAVPRLLALQAALATRDLPGFVEASRRGGHLWLLLEGSVPVAAARAVVLHALEEIRTERRATGEAADRPSFELYPDAGAVLPGALGHAVRLPLGIHRLTGRRYPLFDAAGYPCVFTTAEAAVRSLLALPRIPVGRILGQAAALNAPSLAAPGAAAVAAQSADAIVAREAFDGDPQAPAAVGPRRVGTHSAVIRWVDAYVAIPDLVAELAPLVELRRVGRGYLGWCPFHDDRAPDGLGRPGTPSFYAVDDRRYGWSWRCFSTNCAHHDGPLRHSFRLLQELLELTPAQAIREVCARWPEADARAHQEGDDHDHEDDVVPDR